MHVSPDDGKPNSVLQSLQEKLIFQQWLYVPTKQESLIKNRVKEHLIITAF